MTEAINPLRRVQFSEAGEGRMLYLRNRDFRPFLDKFGPKYAAAVEIGLSNFDFEVVDLVFASALKEADGTPVKGFSIDDLDGITVEEIQVKLLDAYSLSFSGRTYGEQIKEMQARFAEGVEGKPGESPTTSPADSSAGSTEPPPGLG